MNYIKYVLIGLAVAGGLFFLQWLIKKTPNIKKFFLEVWAELLKVAWPTRQELVSSTWIVIITTLILSIFLGAVDYAFSKILSTVIVIS